MKINHYGKRSYIALLKYRLKQAFKLVISISFVGGILAIAFFIGAYSFSTNTVIADNVKSTNTPHTFNVLDRIADCESGSGKKGTGTQFRGGQVLLHANRMELLT